MKFVIYETTNRINGKRYRGAHCCTCEHCSYLGSGKILARAIKKYGVSSFDRIILEECSSIEALFQSEAKWVDAAWVSDPSTYNLKVGGMGGWDYVNKEGHRWTDERRKAWSNEMKKRRLNGLWGPSGNYNPGMTGKKHSAETIAKIIDNNASRLTEDEIATRLADINKLGYPNRGSIKLLSERWGISHTSVRRFINQNWLPS